jgi:redox-sensing transcriptional repressor
MNTISSKKLGEVEGVTSSQVRKDLSLFGSFGTKGLGYPVPELKRNIAYILGLDRKWRVGLVGVGNVGSALTAYKEFHKQGFDIVVAFDNDKRKIGSKRGELVVRDVEDIEEYLKKEKVDMMILAVPADQAQKVAEKVVGCGIRAILNFAPISLRLPPCVFVRDENMVIELEALSFSLMNRRLTE